MKKIEFLSSNGIDPNNINLLKTILKKLYKLEKLAGKKDMIQIRGEITNLRQDIEKLELRMIIKLGSLIAFSISILATLITLS